MPSDRWELEKLRVIAAAAWRLVNAKDKDREKRLKELEKLLSVYYKE